MTTKATSETAPESQNFMDQFPETIIAKSYGNWVLGFDWLCVTPTGSDTGHSALAIYARLHVKDPVKTIVVRMKDAVAFAVANRIPARVFGKFMSDFTDGEWGFDLDNPAKDLGGFKVGQLVIVADENNREFTAEITKVWDGGYYTLEVETDAPEHVTWSAHYSRIKLHEGVMK